MKKAFIIGMAVLVTSMSVSFAHAAPAARAPREVLVEYAKQVKEAAFGKSRTAKGLDAQKLKSAQDSIINELNLSSGKNNSLALALKADPAKSAQRLDNLATIVAAKKMAAEISKKDSAEGQSIDAAATASATFMSNSHLTGARKTAKDLSTPELTETTAALTRLETLTDSILTRFSKAERDSYTQILKRHDEIVESAQKGTSEEAFVQAIMEVKGVDKAKALEVVRKLKECV